MLKRLALATALFALCLAPVHAQRQARPAEAPPPPAQAQPAPHQEAAAPATHDDHAGPGYEVATDADAKISQTSHTMTLDGHEIKYTATAGTLPIRLPDGRLAARMFFVAYTKDGENPKTRPVSFLYNGGPGSATVFLHMGSFSPVRAEMKGDGYQPAPPYRLVNNEDSLLDTTDLVFIDAISTGYSRTVKGVDPKQFHGADGDLQAFGIFIRTYLDKYNRWPSPKFLIGESYGTIRSAGLAKELQDRQDIELNGIVFISSLLTYQTLSNAPDNDIAYLDFVPTYTATAWFHKKLPPDLQNGTLQNAVEQSRAFAFGEYASALARGNTISAADEQAVAQKLSHFIGISPQYIEDANLRVSATRFRKELLRDQRLTVGRYDSRMTGIDSDAAGERQDFDPADAAVNGAFTAAFANYIKNDLKWTTDLHYATSGNVRPWSWDEFQNRYMDETDALRETMEKNPYLKLMVACGYYDMATPLAGAEFNFDHLGYGKTFTDRTQFQYYESGHMIYLRPGPHKKLKTDISHFIDGSLGSAGTTSTQN